MEKLYTDASYCDGKGGMAVVASEWAANFGAQWRLNWDIRVANVPQQRAAVLCAACRCRDVNDAEKRAIGMAFLLAHDMMAMVPGLRVEILSDSLIVLGKILSGDLRAIGDDPILLSLNRLWEQRVIILTKVKGHNDYWGNELADTWSKRAWRELGDRAPYSGQAQYQYQYQYTYQKQYQNQY